MTILDDRLGLASDSRKAINILILLAFMLLVGFPAQSIAEDEFTRLEPQDEGLRDDEFMAFRDRLIQAIRFREPERLVTMIDSQILNGVDVPDGAQSFANIWRIDASDSALWAVLEEIVTRGGAYVRSNLGVKFCAPYVFTHFPSDLSVDHHVAVLDENVPVMSDASASSDVLTLVSYAILSVSDWNTVKDSQQGNVDWLKVKLAAQKVGYIDRTRVRSPKLDYHACFLYRGGKWRLFSLLKN